mmetsp:Transcript_6763/g.9444  ORF Transcript_6763/g.9444 Transcript_6763/m.9444 type:complete len:295 (+) Transcript_6763:842-1726(+)
MSQEGYITDILKRYDIPESKKARSPCSPKFLKRQTSGPGSAPADSTLFRSQLMAAAYLGIRTRPDIRFAVGHLASRSSNPSQHDMECLQHLYHYINHTKHYKLRIKPTSLQLTAFIDASFAIHGDGKGHTGIIIMMGDSGLLYTQSSKQKLLGHHSTECELIAVNDGLFTLEQLRGLYQILGLPPVIVNVRQDNSSAMQISENGHGNAKRSKYMTVRVEHIKSALEEKKIRVTKCPPVVQQMRIPSFRNCCRGVLAYYRQKPQVQVANLPTNLRINRQRHIITFGLYGIRGSSM